ncbi:cation:proton antiporter [Nodosilinea sp. LEGE 06152]|uniref:cation:proton antiporter domain-containing protein n=1 Tax=Nodosilinea sp. LEGE 06152 TaxID=2777966 RepID=UPI0018819AA2|nr:cation:proton antiporter [Nodosilinea sp. LEGE 06152]MBE9156042.1 cation:proton antiporter [Nodosilinea sp. LEGE 06152]
MALFLVEPVSETLREPITTFVLLLAIVLVTPPVFERFRLPGLVGLIMAGVLFGGSGLGWLNPDSEIMSLFAEIGKIYLMFVAGLEIDMALFQRTRDRSLAFGMLTFAIPLAGGIAIGLLFNFGWLAAVLIGSLLASHTLLAYPIVQRLGIVGNEAVTVTVGATIFTDIGSLLVLAICLGVNQGDFSALKLATLLGSLALYTIAVLVGLKQLSKLFFRKTGKDEGNQFLFVMLSVFLCALVAQLIGVENIIGAFLAGLAINSVIGDGPVKEKTEFLGSVLFIPMFFVAMGLLLDLQAFGDILRSFELPLIVVGMLLLTKGLASFGARMLYGYSWAETLTMWSLSIPQVAATLAAALVGYEAEIINSEVFNSVILLMLVTAIVGPLVTARSGKRLIEEDVLIETEVLDWLPPPSEIPESFTVVVPVYNPETEQRLIELAAAVARYENGRIIPLAVALAQPQMDSPQLGRAIAHGRQRLEAAQSISATLEAEIDPRLRIEYNVAQAISHLSREENANLIVLGMGTRSRLGGRLFSNIQDEILWSAHCPVVVARLLGSLTNCKNILLPIENLSPAALRTLRFAQVLASSNQAKITLLHVHGSRASELQRNRLAKQLELLVKRLPTTDVEIEIQLLAGDNVVSTIVKTASQYDLVMLRLQRRRVGNGLTVGASTTPLVDQLSGSVILVGEPHPQRSDRPVPRDRAAFKLRSKPAAT